MFSLITNKKVLQPSISLSDEERIFDDPYKNGLHELVVYYAKQPNPENLILKFQSIRSVIEAFYQVLVNYKELEEIGTLSEAERRRIYDLTKGLEKSERVKASRAIYLIGKIIGND